MALQRTSPSLRTALLDRLRDWGYAYGPAPSTSTTLVIAGMATSVALLGVAGVGLYNNYDNTRQDNQVVSTATHAYPGSQAIDPQLLGLEKSGNREHLITQANTSGGLDIVAIASAATGENAIAIDIPGAAAALGVSTANVCPVNPAEWQAALAAVHRDGTATVACNDAGIWTITGRDANEISTPNSRTVTINSRTGAGIGIND